MSKGWNYNTSDWWITCDVCGKKMKASKSRHRWDGFIVCDKDFEHRHPQDFIRVRPDRMAVPFNRPKEDPYFGGTDVNGDNISVTYLNTLTCTPVGSSGVADYAVADCARADSNFGGFL